MSQLVAPGKLATPHGSLDGLRHCTSCHRLGTPGIINERCLGCHDLIRTRVTAGAGYHATVAAQNCATCHQDHHGRQFALVRLDTASFDHQETGHALRGAHARVACRDCHQPANVGATDVLAAANGGNKLSRTLLGVVATCDGCHREDDPHGAQFARRECVDCHGETSWSDVDGFDHSTTRYPLTGQHRDVSCEKCHGRTASGESRGVRYRGTPFSNCSSCHKDPHSGGLGQECATCHATSGWLRVSRSRLRRQFDHATTGFTLRGRHETIDCGDCHDRRGSERPGIRLQFAAASRRTNFPAPAAEGCHSCHVDPHRGVFSKGSIEADCAACHGELKWLPTSYGIDRHNRAARFELTGAHLATPCDGCHRPARSKEAIYRFDRIACEACHADEDPHADQFGETECETCHTATAFRPSTFDHSTARFRLDGAHRSTNCEACHAMETTGGKSVRRYSPIPFDCRDCHGGGNR